MSTQVTIPDELVEALKREQARYVQAVKNWPNNKGLLFSPDQAQCAVDLVKWDILKHVLNELGAL